MFKASTGRVLMKHYPLFAMLGSWVLVITILTPVGAATQPTTQVEFSSVLHFLTPSGEDVEVGPGIYEVETAESWLKLVPEGESPASAVLLEALAGAHQESLTQQTVRLERDTEHPDVFHLAMLLPGGTGLETIGTTSGIFSRGVQMAILNKPVSPSQMLIGKVAVGTFSATQTVPAICDNDKIQQVRAKASSTYDEETIDCQLTLQKEWTITKRLVFEGAKASGVTLDCRGATIGDGTDTDKIQVRSRKYKDVPPNDPRYEQAPWKWERPENVTIKYCQIIGSVRVWGIGMNGEAEEVRESSKREPTTSMNHRNRLRDNAPKHTMFDHVTITGLGRNPFYLSPGVTYTTLMNSEIKGKSNKVGIYLDAESAYNTIKGNSIHVVTPEDEWGKVPGVTDRGWPLIAIDGSTGNKILNNNFSSLNNGGIYLYRNCGEGGTIRHSTPSHNEIINNIFYYNKYTGSKPAVYLGSRDYGLKERLGHCNDDDGRPYGSSASEKDYAQHNVIMQNQFYLRHVYRPTPVGIITLVEASIADYVKTKNDKVNSPNYIDHNQIVTAQTEVKNRRAGCYLSHANQNFLIHGESLEVLKDTRQTACLTHYSCTDGELPQSLTQDCRVKKIEFSCQVIGNNKGCEKVVACPSGQKLVGAKAVCNLEFGTVSDQAVQSLNPDLIQVLKASDNVSAGSCHVGFNKIQKGQSIVSRIKGSPSVGVGCQEYDKNGGDCHIKGVLYCQ